MKTLEDCITVDVPMSRAYYQWTQFEESQIFMEGVKALGATYKQMPSGGTRPQLGNHGYGR
jgi:hypothetical protein